MNPTHLAYYVGYSDIGVTLKAYTHVYLESVQEEIKRIEKNRIKYGRGCYKGISFVDFSNSNKNGKT